MHRPLALFAALFLAAPAAAQIILPTEPGDGLGTAPLTVRNQHIVVEIDSQIGISRWIGADLGPFSRLMLRASFSIRLLRFSYSSSSTDSTISKASNTSVRVSDSA